MFSLIFTHEVAHTHPSGQGVSVVVTPIGKSRMYDSYKSRPHGFNVLVCLSAVPPLPAAPRLSLLLPRNNHKGEGLWPAWRPPWRKDLPSAPDQPWRTGVSPFRPVVASCLIHIL